MNETDGVEIAEQICTNCGGERDANNCTWYNGGEIRVCGECNRLDQTGQIDITCEHPHTVYEDGTTKGDTSDADDELTDFEQLGQADEGDTVEIEQPEHEVELTVASVDEHAASRTLIAVDDRDTLFEIEVDARAESYQVFLSSWGASVTGEDDEK